MIMAFAINMGGGTEDMELDLGQRTISTQQIHAEMLIKGVSL